MRILLVTDAWSPQVNGVVRSLQTVCGKLSDAGHEILRISPEAFRSIPCPTYPEIRLAFGAGSRIETAIGSFAPDAIHIATEGPLGLAARSWCVKHGVRFTTAYHTQFPDYMARRTRLSPKLFWRFIRWFHGPAERTLVATPSIAAELEKHGIGPLHRWGRGVDLDLFLPDAAPHPLMSELPRPIQLYVGRVAVEKNLEAFLASSHPGTKVVVGDGPARKMLAKTFPDCLFLGALGGTELASAYATADVFVFPSRTDTFGLVMIEALACGTPVAAYPVSGPADVLTQDVGALDDDIEAAITSALTRDRAKCHIYAQQFTWDASAEQFLSGLAIRGEVQLAADLQARADA